MFSLLVLKELRSLLFSPKFAATFGAAAILVLLSVEIGIQEYGNAVRQTATARQLTYQRMAQQPSYASLSAQAYRDPDPLQVFVTGIANDVGRYAGVNQTDPVKMRNSTYADDPIFALFRSIDFAFIVTVVLSLFAILFSYDAINGEREQGTLQLTFSNPVSRVQYLLAKFAGAWLGLIVPLTIPVLLSVLLVIARGVPMTGSDWLRFGVLLGLSLLLFTVFLAFGFLVSALTRRSSDAFLFCLAGWILFVLVVPRAGMMTANLLIPVPSVAEVEGQRDAFAKDQWEQYLQESEKRWERRNSPAASMNPSDREAYRDAHQQEWMDEEESARKQMQARIEDEGKRLEETYRNLKSRQESLGFTLAMISPASAYQIATMRLAGTDAGLKARYEDAIRDYRKAFLAYTERKQKESGSPAGLRIMFDTDKGLSISMPRNQGMLELSDMPQFTLPPAPLHEILSALVPHVGLLASLMLFIVAGAMAAFLRYDVR